MILSHHIDIGFTGTVIEKGNCKYLPFYEDELVAFTCQMRNLLKSFMVDKYWRIGSWTSR